MHPHVSWPPLWTNTHCLESEMCFCASVWLFCPAVSPVSAQAWPCLVGGFPAPCLRQSLAQEGHFQPWPLQKTPEAVLTCAGSSQHYAIWGKSVFGFCIRGSVSGFFALAQTTLRSLQGGWNSRKKSTHSSLQNGNFYKLRWFSVVITPVKGRK